MRKTSLAIKVILVSWMCSTPALAQKSVQTNGTSTNPAFVQAEQLFVLADSKDAGATAKIKEALASDSWYLRGEAAMAIVRLGDKSNAALLLPLIHDQNWFVRGAALRAIMLLGAKSDSTAVDPAASDLYLRASALATADTASIDLLTKSLNDSDDMVRRTAAISLGRLKAAGAADNLLALLKDENQSVQKASAIALGQIGDKRAASAVLASIQDPSAMDWEYAAALYRLGNRDYLDKITASLKSEYPDARQGSFRTLLEFADNSTLPPLLALTTLDTPWAKKDSADIRLLLAESLSKFSGEQPQTALINLVDDPEPAVRAAAVMSILKISRTDPRSESSQRFLVTLVSALKKESSPVVTDAIVEALVPFDRARVTDLLLDARNPDGKLNANALKALAASGVTADSQPRN
jgi:HEAT repeat protein